MNSGNDLIACGSETNEVYIYHSKLSKPILSHKFGNNLDSITVIHFVLCFNDFYNFKTSELVIG